MAKYEILVKGGDKVLNMFKNVSKTTKETQELNKSLEKTAKISKVLAKQNKQAFDSKNAVKNLGKTKSSVKDIEGQMKALKTIVATDLGFDVLTNSGKKFGNILKGMGKEDHLKKLAASTKVFTAGFGEGRKQGMSFLQSIGHGFKRSATFIKLALGGLKGFIATLAGAALPILGIIAAFKLLQRMWQLNVGGMQTQWGKMMGAIKTSIGKFNAEMSKVLRKLSPIIELLLQPLIMNMKFVWSIAKGVFKGIWEIIKPIFDAFAEIGIALKEAFGGSNAKNVKIFDTILKGISVTLQWIGKIIGFVVKVALMPFVNGIKNLIKIGKILADVFQPVFGAIKELLISIYNTTLKPLVDGFKNIISLFKQSGKESKSSFGWLWKTLKFILDVAIMPLTLSFKALSTVFKIIGKVQQTTFGWLWNTLKSIAKWISSTPMFQSLIEGALKIKEIFVGLKDSIMGTLQTAWDFILGIINKIPDVLLPKSIQSLKTNGSAAQEAQSSNVNNVRNINNNQQMTFNTGRATTPDQSQMFADMLVTQLSR